MKKRMFIGMILALVLVLNACGGDSSVSVQRADQLAIAGQAGDRYAGMVVSDNVVEIPKDGSKTVKEMYVTLGQEVKAGDKLFSYDSDALELDLEKAKLEVEKMTNDQATYTEQLEKLEKQLAKTKNVSTITRLTLEINTLETTQMENNYNIAAKEQEIEKLQEMLSNVDIIAPVDGTIRKIDEENQGSAYITIQQSGAYRVKGTINEMEMSKLMVGTRVKIFSRVTDETWMGTIASIDMNPEQNNNDRYYGMIAADSGMMTTSKYPFYVDLDNVEGLLLGQHVYMEVAGEEPAMPGLWIPEGFLMDMVFDDETGEITGAVWVANSRDKLERRTVSLGMRDDMTGCFEVLSGLAAEDYVADPMAPGCENGASVTYRDAEDFNAANDVPDGTEPLPDEGGEGQLPTDGGMDVPEDGGADPLPDESGMDIPEDGGAESLPEGGDLLPAETDGAVKE